MSSSNGSFLLFAAQQVTIYLATPIFIIGIVGNILNIIIFLSLNTFRENSCAFYLTMMSIANIGQLLTGVLSRIMGTGFNIDLLSRSVFYCKFSWFCIQQFILTSFTCMCLATIDQYLATCSNPRWQQWSNIKMAHRLTGGIIFIWLFHGIPYWIYFDLAISPVTYQLKCGITNSNFNLYNTYVFDTILTSIIPLCITIIFGSLCYRNVQQLAHRTVPLVRREVEKQLSSMVFVHIIYNVIATVPSLIETILLASPLVDDPLTSIQLNFVSSLVLCLFFLNFSVS
jgi:hypothetical protein